MKRVLAIAGRWLFYGAVAAATWCCVFWMIWTGWTGWGASGPKPCPAPVSSKEFQEFDAKVHKTWMDDAATIEARDTEIARLKAELAKARPAHLKWKGMLVVPEGTPKGDYGIRADMDEYCDPGYQLRGQHNANGWSLDTTIPETDAICVPTGYESIPWCDEKPLPVCDEEERKIFGSCQCLKRNMTVGGYLPKGAAR